MQFIYKKERGLRKKNLRKNFRKKISKQKFITINQCDTIFALQTPLDRNREKDRE